MRRFDYNRIRLAYTPLHDTAWVVAKSSLYFGRIFPWHVCQWTSKLCLAADLPESPTGLNLYQFVVRKIPWLLELWLIIDRVLCLLSLLSPVHAVQIYVVTIIFGDIQIQQVINDDRVPTALEKSLKFWSVSRSLKNHWISWKVLEICKNDKIMEYSLNFGPVTHGKIIEFWNRCSFDW